jgi:geranylgeranyl pyrophosphate synthase
MATSLWATPLARGRGGRMSARPRQRTEAAGGLPALVDDALSPSALDRATHAEDWPEQPASPALPISTALPRAVWDGALGDVARDILGRPSRQFRARMCELGWRLADGRGDAPPSLPALVEIVHAGSLIVDDIEDGSKLRRGAAAVHIVHGVPRTINTGTWMYFWALDLVDRLPLPRPTRERIREALAQALHRGHLGQALDLSVSIGRMPRALVYRTVATSTMLKTGALMELAAVAGALAAGASDDSIEAIAQFGRRMGLGLQMLDDFGNLTAPTTDSSDTKALEDLRNDRPTWPWARAAVDLDAAAFSQLQASARALSEGGDPDGTRARALAAELRMAVGMKGRRQAALYLDNALHDLRRRIGERDELGLLASEIERLEVSYG